MNEVKIVTENEKVFTGKTPHRRPTSAELVFTTSYTGYEESLTDPSYNGQALCFAYPLIGNYGVDSRRFESERIHPDAVLMRECTDECLSWLMESNTTIVNEVNTRDIVHCIREDGAISCGIANNEKKARELCSKHQEGTTMKYKPKYSNVRRYNQEADNATVGIIDCGVKKSIVEQFLRRNVEVVVIPYTVCNFEKISEYNLDLLFVSNGPGNPSRYESVIEVIRQAREKIPISGICLGQQIVTIAFGGSTKKMKFGHRGTNQPVYDKRNNRVRITTQNHQYCIEKVPESLNITQYNVNDNSPEGLSGDSVLTVQYHPEAHPGPRDSYSFFDEVLQMVTS